MRRIVRIFVGVLAVAAWLVALALAALLVISRTDWGRNKIARAVERQLELALDAEVVIGRLEGDLPAHIVVRDFRLVRAGETVLSADRLELRFEILALRGRTLHLQEIHLDKPLVRADRLAGLVKPKPEPGPLWHLTVDELTVTGGHLFLQGATVEGITVEGRARWSDDEGWVVLRRLSGRWSERGLEALASGGVWRENGHTVVLNARVEAAGAWAYVPVAVDRAALASFYVPDEGSGVAAVAFNRVVARLQVIHAPVHAKVQLLADLAEQSLSARVDGRAAGVDLKALHLKARRHGDQVGVSARMGRDRLRALVGRTGGWVEAKVTRPALELDGRARVALKEGVTRINVDRLAFRFRRLLGHARGGQVVLRPGGAVTVSNLQIFTDAGRIDVGGSIAGVGKRQRGDARLHVHAQRLDLGKVRAALGVAALPRQGLVAVDAHAMRRGQALAFDADLTAQRLSWRAQDPPVDVRAKVGLRPGRLSASVTLEAGAAGRAALVLESRAPQRTLDGRAWARLAPRDVRRAHITLTRLDLATVARVTGKPGSMSGVVDGEITVPEHARRFTGTFQARRLLGREMDADVTMSWADPGLDADIVGYLGGARVGQATVHLGLPVGRPLAEAAGAPLQVSAHVEDFPIDRLNRAGLVRAPMTGILRANLDVTGSIRDPRVEGDAHLLGGHVGAARFYRVEVEGRADLRGAKAKVEATQTSGGRISADVDAPRDPAGRTRATLKARAFDLAFLAAVAPNLGLGGLLDADLRFDGPRTAPRVQGVVRVQKGRALVEGGARRLDDVTLRARIEPGRIVVDEMRARTGKGNVAVTGEAYLEGFIPRRFDANVTTQNLAVVAGTRVVRVDLQAGFTGGAGPEGWRLEARVRRGFVKMPRESQGALQKVGELEDVAYVDQQARRELAQATLEARERRRDKVSGVAPQASVHISFLRGIRVRGPDIDARVNADLQVEAGKRTTVNGFVQVEQGTVTLFDRRYEVRRGRAWFDGTSADPQIDVLLAHEFRTATVYVALEGHLKAPRLRLSSDPAIYDDAQLLGFVLGGDPDDPALADRRLEQRAVGVASSLVVSQVRNRLRSVLPVDVLRVELGEEQAVGGGSKFEVGKWLTNNILVGYRFRSTSAEDENSNEGTFEWHFLRRWVLEARYGDRGVGSTDVLWRKRY